MEKCVDFEKIHNDGVSGQLSFGWSQNQSDTLGAIPGPTTHGLRTDSVSNLTWKKQDYENVYRNMVSITAI